MSLVAVGAARGLWDFLHEGRVGCHVMSRWSGGFWSVLRMRNDFRRQLPSVETLTKSILTMLKPDTAAGGAAA